MNFFLAMLFLSALPARADDYPIAPVHVALTLQPDRLVADVRGDSIYWIEEILDTHPLPAGDWREYTRRKAEDYLNAHLRLRADGAPLRGRLIGAQYVQRPWQITEQGEVRLRLAYPAPPAGARISGEADFYQEYYEEVLQRYKGRSAPVKQVFEAILRLRGSGQRLVLRPGAMSFSFSADNARLKPTAQRLDALKAGALAVLDSASAWPALLALGLALAPGLSLKRAASGALAAGVGACAAALQPAPAVTPWLCGMIAAAGCWMELGTEALALVALAGLGWTWATLCAPELPAAMPSPILRATAGVGGLAAAGALLALIFWFLAAQRQRLELVSQFRAEELRRRRKSLAATALLIACFIGVTQYLPAVGQP